MSKRVFINGFNSVTGGGRSILNSVIGLIGTQQTNWKYCVLVRDAAEYRKHASKDIVIVDLPKICRVRAFYPFVNRFVIPRMIKSFNANSVLNFADIATPVNVHQVFYFDWPYAIYTDPFIWNQLDFPGWISRKIKLHYVKKYKSYVNEYVVQTRTVQNRLREKLGIFNTHIVPNAVSFDEGSHNPNSLKLIKDKSEKYFYLLCLAYYYPHKNIEILVELCQKIKELELPFRIVITISPNQHKNARQILKNIERRNVGDILLNVGPLDAIGVRSIYSEVDAVILPTILETFSGSYVEAMHYGKPIYTSDMDFAKDVCGDAAEYFDPNSIDSILRAISKSLSDPDVNTRLIAAGKKQLEKYGSWENSISQIWKLL